MADEHSHPSDAEYIKIAIVLALVTVAEVAVFYVQSLRPLILWLLMPMMVLKFALVVLWFMHLRFDSKIFRRLFLTGIFFALGVFTIVLVTLAR